MISGCPGANPSLLPTGLKPPPRVTEAGPWEPPPGFKWTRLVSLPLELAGLNPEPNIMGPLVGVEAPELGPGVGLKAIGRIRALP